MERGSAPPPLHPQGPPKVSESRHISHAHIRALLYQTNCDIIVYIYFILLSFVYLFTWTLCVWNKWLKLKKWKWPWHACSSQRQIFPELYFEDLFTNNSSLCFSIFQVEIYSATNVDILFSLSGFLKISRKTWGEHVPGITTGNVRNVTVVPVPARSKKLTSSESDLYTYLLLSLWKYDKCFVFVHDWG